MAEVVSSEELRAVFLRMHVAMAECDVDAIGEMFSAASNAAKAGSRVRCHKGDAGGPNRDEPIQRVPALAALVP